MDYIEIDKLVAEKVMGYTVIYEKGWNVIEAKGENRNGYFSPSKEIRHAWEIVEKLKQEDQYYFRLENGDFYDYECYFIDYFSKEVFTSEDDSPSMAICKAALRVYGIEIK